MTEDELIRGMYDPENGWTVERIAVKLKTPRDEVRTALGLTPRKESIRGHAHQEQLYLALRNRMYFSTREIAGVWEVRSCTAMGRLTRMRAHGKIERAYPQEWGRAHQGYVSCMYWKFTLQWLGEMNASHPRQEGVDPELAGSSEGDLTGTEQRNDTPQGD